MHERWVGNCVLIVLRWSPNNWSNWSSNSWNDAGKYRVNIVEEWKFDRQDSFCAQLADTQHAHGKSTYLFFFSIVLQHTRYIAHIPSLDQKYTCMYRRWNECTMYALCQCAWCAQYTPIHTERDNSERYNNIMYMVRPRTVQKLYIFIIICGSLCYNAFNSWTGQSLSVCVCERALLCMYKILWMATSIGAFATYMCTCVTYRQAVQANGAHRTAHTHRER